MYGLGGAGVGVQICKFVDVEILKTMIIAETRFPSR